MASTLSTISEILPESAKYAEKALWGWYPIQDPGAGTKRCYIPEVRDLSSGSKDKALSIWISRIFLNLGAQ